MSDTTRIANIEEDARIYRMAVAELKRTVKEHEQRIVEGIIRESEFEKRIAELEHNMIFLLELGIEKHIGDHNRELHQREMALDFADAQGLSRAGI